MADKAVPTWYGEFNPVYYEAVHSRAGESIGINMYMDFHPGDRVIDATKIGFAQTVKTVVGNETITKTKHESRKKLVKDGVGAGYHLDQLDKYKNPLYATGTKKEQSVEKPKNKLEGYEASDIKKIEDITDTKELSRQTVGGEIVDRKYYHYGEFGYRYPKSDSVTPQNPNATPQDKSPFYEKNASFQDTPHDFNVLPDSSQEFETTAMIADGKQKGLYLGSVNWGWKRDGSSTFQKLPFVLKSEGAPSEIFFKSAERWNNSRTIFGKKTVNMPMSEGTVLKDQLKFYKKTKEADIDPTKQDKQLAKGTRLRLIKEEGNYLYVRILDAAETFEEGFVPNSENGEATIDDSKTFLNWPKPEKSMTGK
jgi:hypothetical protein